MTIPEMTAILRGDVKFYDSPEDVQSKLNEIADELERLRAERDAAVTDLRIRGGCEYCKHYTGEYQESGICSKCGWDSKWEWRGVQHD